MCSPESLVLLAALVAGVVAAISGVVSEGRFVERLRQSHAGQWRALSRLKVWFHDGDPQYVSAQRYLWSGAYKSLEDPYLDRLALRTRLSMCCVVLAVAAWSLIKLIFPSVSLLSCVGQ